MRYCIYCGTVVEKTNLKYYCSDCIEYLYEGETADKNPFFIRRVLTYLLSGLALIGASLTYYLFTL